jgi:hypothetical protein
MEPRWPLRPEPAEGGEEWSSLGAMIGNWSGCFLEDSPRLSSSITKGRECYEDLSLSQEATERVTDQMQPASTVHELHNVETSQIHMSGAMA